VSIDVVVDTNVILRFLLGDHQDMSAAAERVFAPLRLGEAVGCIPEAVWAECVFLLSKTYGVPREVVAEKLDALAGYRGLQDDKMPIVRAALAVFAEHNVAFADALALAHAERYGATLVSFDRKLQKLWSRRSKRPPIGGEAQE
jgi:predicted nucleic-acid-binding protein